MSWKRERFCGGKQKGRGGRFASSTVKQLENPRPSRGIRGGCKHLAPVGATRFGNRENIKRNSTELDVSCPSKENPKAPV